MNLDINTLSTLLQLLTGQSPRREQTEGLNNGSDASGGQNGHSANSGQNAQFGGYNNSPYGGANPGQNAQYGSYNNSPYGAYGGMNGHSAGGYQGYNNACRYGDKSYAYDDRGGYANFDGGLRSGAPGGMCSPFVTQNRLGERLPLKERSEGEPPLSEILSGGRQNKPQDLLSGLLPLMINMKQPPAKTADSELAKKFQSILAQKGGGAHCSESNAKGESECKANEPAERAQSCQCNKAECAPSEPNVSASEHAPTGENPLDSEKTASCGAPYGYSLRTEQNSPQATADMRQSSEKLAPESGIKTLSADRKFQPIMFAGYALISALNTLLRCKGKRV